MRSFSERNTKLQGSGPSGGEMFSISGLLRSHFRYLSTSSDLNTPKTHLNLFVEYLMNSLRFSREEALSVASKSKITHLKSPANSDLVVNVFKDYGLDNNHIKLIVSSAPKVLTHKANKTLAPKVKIFHQLGLSGSDLVKLIKKNPNIFSMGLSTNLIPMINFLRTWLGSNAKVIEAINKSRWLNSSTIFKRISANVVILQDYRLSNEYIAKLLLIYPNTLSIKPQFFEAQLFRVEEELGIPRESRLFIHALYAVMWYSKSRIDEKLEVFRSFGWSNLEALTLVRVHPLCLTLSEAVISDKLKFFMKELGHKPAYLTSNLSLLSCSLEKRVKPRYKILEILKDKKLMSSNPSLTSCTKYSEVQFQKFLRRFEKEVPGLYENYTNSIR